MSAESFMKLVEEYRGFEFYQACRDDIDHVIGGKGDTFWYTVMKKNKVIESYIGVYRDGTWGDTYKKGSGEPTAMPSGTTIARIAEKAYLMQEENWVKDRKGHLIEDSHPHYHYVYGIGDKAIDISEKYGVTIGYSNIKDTSEGFILRHLFTGEDVELP